jgi:DNA-directed RNA polymerase specialized sigma24 family protein
MGYHDETSMGGTAKAFLTTHWSLIKDFESDDKRNRSLINLLIQRYWKPVYFYLRRKGYDNEQAKDLTQGFFYEVVLSRRLVQTADPAKGRFRSLLLSALERYLIDQISKETAKKRIPKEKLFSLDVSDNWDLPDVVSESSPDDSYNYGWVSALLDQILSQVQAKCKEQGMEVHWNIFNDRIVRPIVKGVASPSLTEICRKYGIETEKKASNMTITVKRCFQAALKECIRNTVTSEQEINKELKEIMRFFPESAQHSD